jgi:SET domain-containing protein
VTSFFWKKRIFQPEGIEIRRSSLHGNGVFAIREFKKGDTIEIAPVILLPGEEKALLQTTFLFGYYFLINDAEIPVALGLGYSSLYNHDYKANAAYGISLREKLITIKAWRPIRINDEIVLNYNGTPDDETPVYFPPDTVA